MNRTLFKKYKICPSKHLGQNFLIDSEVLKKIIKAANLQPEDIVLEIGPGIGNLTRELAKRVKKVIAVEKDKRMCKILKETLKDFKNIKIIQGDILEIQNSKLKIKNYKVVANLPYYITSPVIRKFLELPNPPKEMVLMVQKEVAQRICPRPPKLEERRRGKTPRMNLLAISVQFYAEPEIIDYVSKESFWPVPKVDSAIIRISQIRTNLPQIDTNLFFKVVKAGFSHPRKQLANNLANGLKLNKKELSSLLLKNNIQPSQRAETLTIQDWLKLTNVLK